MALADFSGAVYADAHFQRIAQISKNSFTHVFFITNDLSAADLAHADFCQVSVLSKKDRLLKLCKEIGCLFFKSFVFYGIPQSKSREIEKNASGITCSDLENCFMLDSLKI